MKNLIIIGPQGCGKGTQAELLSKKLGIPHISTGDIFREMREKDTPLGHKIKDLIDNGKLVPDEITDEIVMHRLSEKDTKKGYILDGFPRKLSQAEFLDSHAKIDKVIVLKVADNESVRRISARRVCSKCHEGYNTIYIKPKKAGICDKCGGKLVVRDDDKPAAVKERLKKYHEATEPLLKFYEKKDILLKINGEQSIKDVFNDIVKKLK
jgi:adenylate kinase